MPDYKQKYKQLLMERMVSILDASIKVKEDHIETISEFKSFLNDVSVEDLELLDKIIDRIPEPEIRMVE